jgi:acetoin utilization deacetylase AcuC-like enzyme
MLVAFHPIYVHPLPENHRFPMEKYDLLYRQLLYEGIVNEDDIFAPNLLSENDILAVHCSAYWERLNHLKLTEREQRVSGFSHSPQLILRERTIMEGTRQLAENALKTGLGFNIAGGTHHAFHNKGEGFCLLNDQVIAAHWILKNTDVQRILIIDLDVHQGNGTAAMTIQNPEIFTFSMHGESNYPLLKEKSDLDVAVKDGTTDEHYLYLLQSHLEQILNAFHPDFVFYQCGVDVLSTDKLGRLSLSEWGCCQRDRMVFEYVRQLKVPVVCTMGGGYSPKIKDIVAAHTNTFREAMKILH